MSSKLAPKNTRTSSSKPPSSTPVSPAVSRRKCECDRCVSRFRQVQLGPHIGLRIDSLWGQQRGLRRRLRPALGGVRPGAGHLHQRDLDLDELHRDHRQLLRLGIPLRHQGPEERPHDQPDLRLPVQRRRRVHPLVLGLRRATILQRNIHRGSFRDRLRLLRRIPEQNLPVDGDGVDEPLHRLGSDQSPRPRLVPPPPTHKLADLRPHPQLLETLHAHNQHPQSDRGSGVHQTARKPQVSVPQRSHRRGAPSLENHLHDQYWQRREYLPRGELAREGFAPGRGQEEHSQGLLGADRSAVRAPASEVLAGVGVDARRGVRGVERGVVVVPRHYQSAFAFCQRQQQRHGVSSSLFGRPRKGGSRRMHRRQHGRSSFYTEYHHRSGLSGQLRCLGVRRQFSRKSKLFRSLYDHRVDLFGPVELRDGQGGHRHTFYCSFDPARHLCRCYQSDNGRHHPDISVRYGSLPSYDSRKNRKHSLQFGGGDHAAVELYSDIFSIRCQSHGLSLAGLRFSQELHIVVIYKLNLL